MENIAWARDFRFRFYWETVQVQVLLPAFANTDFGKSSEKFRGFCFFFTFFCYNEGVLLRFSAFAAASSKRKGGKTMKLKRSLSLLLAMAMVVGSLGSIPAKAEEERNLALNQAVTASSVANDCGPDLAVNGTKDISEQWNSENMKNGTLADDEQQNEQWLQIDLGVSDSKITKIKLWYNMKVWPMVYRIETTDTPDAEDSWETIVEVSRPSRNGFVQNAEGMDIADENENSDTITLTSSPALEMTEIGRYVRLYIEKVNAQAPGNNVNLREIEIFGTNDAEEPELVICGSELENVISNDGVESQWNIGERDVTVIVQQGSGQSNTVVTVPDHSANYPEEWFPEVADANEKPEVIPTIQEWYGYEGSFKLTEDSKIIINDAANVGLEKAAELMQADLEEISGLKPEILAVEDEEAGDADDIYIESLTDADAYDLGEEGYLMVTNEEGIKIYAPTYTGCVFGTVTVEQILWLAEDHVSVPMGIMRDYPAYEVRGIKLDIARTPYRYQQLLDYAKIMRWYKMSEYDLHINDNDNANINGATYETHSGFHRLESEEFPSMTSETKHAGIPADTVNEDYYNNNEDYQGNPVYTKEQWRDLAALAEDYGMYLLTEIDLPGHSLLYNKYADENPDNIDWLEGGIAYTGNGVGTAGGIELLDLTGENSERALRFAKTLWDEYTRGDEPTIYGDIVHIGADEYWDHSAPIKTGFATFADEMRKVIQGNLGEDTKIRMWGAGGSNFSTADTVLGMTDAELAEHYQLDIWHTAYDNPSARAKEGYDIVNCRDAFLYGNPGRTNRDVPNSEYLFYDWTPANFGGNNPLLGEPHLIGAKAVIWGDQSQEGMTEKDIHQRVLRAIAIVSEKTWNGTDEDDTFAEYEIRASRLAEGPGTQIAMEVESASSLVVSYDFANISSDRSTIYDISGNGYDAALTGGHVADGWLEFDGETLLETPVQTLSYPYTVTVDLKITEEDREANTEESSLFSGYDGRIQIAGQDGHVSADVNYFTRDFEYTVPTEEIINLTIVGTMHGTKLYVDGEMVSFLSQKNDVDGVQPGAIPTLYSSVLLPLEKIGQEFHGQMSSLKAYNKAFSAEEVDAMVSGDDDGKVNVAQNAHIGGESYKSGDAQDNGEQRTRIAMKAIDGDAFAVAASTTSQPDAATSDIYSYWKGDHADSSLTVDLGEEREISEIGIQWRYGGKGKDMEILTSHDGENWTTAKTVTGNQDFFQTITFAAPISARYVKLQGIASNGSGYMVQELMIYEAQDKTELSALAEEAEALAEEKSIGFEAEDAKEQSFYDALILAKALNEDSMAVQKEIDLAAAELAEAMEELLKVVENPFEDIAEADYFYDAVLWAVDQKITQGVTETTFVPYQSCTRADIVTFLYRAMKGTPSEQECNFTDINPADYYYTAMMWAVEAGITTGMTEDTFAPYALCTREQIVTFLWRAMGEPEASAKVNFDDVTAADYFYNAILWAVEKGVTTGQTADSFGAYKPCYRADSVLFLQRALSK